MKVLFVTAKGRDHLALTLWHGLQEVLGWDNVVDAVGVPALSMGYIEEPDERDESSRGFNTAFACREFAVSGVAKTLLDTDKDFDLLVVNSCFIDAGGRNQNAAWAEIDALRKHLKPDGKIAYVEGNDSAHYVCYPQRQVDAVFKKEIDPAFPYPYKPHHLTFAAPKHWFRESGWRRDIDVFYTGNPDTNGCDKWRMSSLVFQTRRHHRAIVGSCGLGWADYLNALKRSKLALCPATAAGADSMRTYEAVACGAIPVFVDYPNFVREPWFPPEVCCSCKLEDLPDLLDSALDGHDLEPQRQRLRTWALEHHTAAARARKLLEVAGCGGR